MNLRLIGREVDVFLVPESAFRTQETVLRVDQESRLHTREVQGNSQNGQRGMGNRWLVRGDRVCVTPIEIISEGMQVNLVNPVEDSNQTHP